MLSHLTSAAQPRRLVGGGPALASTGGDEPGELLTRRVGHTGSVRRRPRQTTLDSFLSVHRGRAAAITAYASRRAIGGVSRSDVGRTEEPCGGGL